MMAKHPKGLSRGATPWLTTFADLMSLLLCFFVLLLSMARMDVEKFKHVADSLKLAFGNCTAFAVGAGAFRSPHARSSGSAPCTSARSTHLTMPIHEQIFLSGPACSHHALTIASAWPRSGLTFCSPVPRCGRPIRPEGVGPFGWASGCRAYPARRFWRPRW